jgi:hypothetical protein
MMAMWADTTELYQTEFLKHSKEQIEYKRIDEEYEFVKKRALVNFLINSKISAEASFHNRTIAMLN